MTLKPLADRIVARQLEAEEKTKSGIVLPGSAQEKPQEAKGLIAMRSCTHGVSESLPTVSS